ncbi:MAG: hypothetical protein MMC33_002176, partial [Icmadophila ericetorum]|nr:hypothetical protein [Icmadophila ericetorum]
MPGLGNYDPGSPSTNVGQSSTIAPTDLSQIAAAANLMSFGSPIPGAAGGGSSTGQPSGYSASAGPVPLPASQVNQIDAG